MTRGYDIAARTLYTCTFAHETSRVLKSLLLRWVASGQYKEASRVQRENSRLHSNPSRHSYARFATYGFEGIPLTK